MWRDALLVAGKDLRIELRSRVVLNQVLPFGVLVLVLFALALGPGRSTLLQAAPGLFWVAVLFSSVLAVQRSFAIEATGGTRDGLRLAGLEPAGVFLGKAAAVAVQLAALEIVLGAGVVFLYGAGVRSLWGVTGACLLATLGLAASGTIYGALAVGLEVRETLLPFLLLPVVAPVHLAGTRAWQAALSTGAGSAGSLHGAGVLGGAGFLGGGDPWIGLLAVFAAVYLSLGVLVFGSIEEAA
ncbi:MAG: heme exporter protein CcmB [Acidimicrobiales bacterium]